MQGHLERSFNFFHLSSITHSSSHESISTFGWRLSGCILIPCKYYPQIPDSYIVTSSCKIECHNTCGCHRIGEICTEYCNCENCANVQIR